MSGELPEGWAMVTLGDVAEIIMGQAPPGSRCNREGRGTVFVKAGEFAELHPLIREWTTEPLRMAKAGDVLICVVGATCGKLNLGIDAAIGRSVAAIRPSKALLQKFLYFHLLPRVLELRRSSTGSAQGVLQREQLLNLEIPLPPLNEQRRIVARLEKLEARLRRARTALEEIPAQLAQARRALLAAAFRGDLTAEWRDKKSDLSIWEEKTIGDVCSESFYGPRFSEHDYCSDGIPTIRTTDFLPGGGLDVLGAPRVRVPHEKRDKFMLRTGDLLVTRTGSIGKMAVFSGDYDAIPSAYLIRFRFFPEIQSRFVFYCLSSPKWQELMGLSSTSVTQPNINAEAIKALPISVPPLPEQREIVRRVERGLARLDAAAAAQAAAVADLDRLEQSLLAKAFRGALVPQDPADEPAATMLARLAGARSESRAVKPVRRRRPC